MRLNGEREAGAEKRRKDSRAVGRMTQNSREWYSIRRAGYDTAGRK